MLDKHSPMNGGCGVWGGGVALLSKSDERISKQLSRFLKKCFCIFVTPFPVGKYIDC